jgi:hypothetical protein
MFDICVTDAAQFSDLKRGLTDPMSRHGNNDGSEIAKDILADELTPAKG